MVVSSTSMNAGTTTMPATSHGLRSTWGPAGESAATVTCIGTVKLAGVLGGFEQRRCRFEHPRDPRSMGLFRRLVREALPKIAVENGGPNLKQKMSAPLRPLHLLLFDHPSGDERIHGGLSQRR